MLDLSRVENFTWKQVKFICKKIGLNPSKRDVRVAFAGLNAAYATEVYALPHNVDKELKVLFRTWPIAKNSPLEALKWIVKFLKIHPLHDGNGRVARILFSALILSKTFDSVRALQISNDILNREEERSKFLQAAHLFVDFDNASALGTLLKPHFEDKIT